MKPARFHARVFFNTGFCHGGQPRPRPVPVSCEEILAHVKRSVGGLTPVPYISENLVPETGPGNLQTTANV